jgi:protein SCO1
MSQELKRNKINITVIALLAFVALIVGLFVSQHIHVRKKIDRNAFHGTLLENPRAINQFKLTGIDDKPFTNDNLKGKWTMIFFGFTNCGYLCPTTMAELGKMYRLLEDKNIKRLPQVVMVSIDPQRDSITKLGQYVKAFDSHFLGARGSQDSIDVMTKEMGIVHMKVLSKTSPEASKNYDIEHSGTVMLFNPEGQLSAFFSMPHDAQSIATDYAMLVS